MELCDLGWLSCGYIYIYVYIYTYVVFVVFDMNTFDFRTFGADLCGFGFGLEICDLG